MLELLKKLLRFFSEVRHARQRGRGIPPPYDHSLLTARIVITIKIYVDPPSFLIHTTEHSSDNWKACRYL